MSAYLGTIPQWGTFGSLLTLIALLLKYGAGWLSAFTERSAARAAADATAAEGWRDIEQRVSEELAECRRLREADATAKAAEAEKAKRRDDEIFRLRILLSMAFDEFDKLDPGSEFVLKARAIMAVSAPSGDPEDVEEARLAELLARIPDHGGKRAAATTTRRRPRRGK